MGIAICWLPERVCKGCGALVRGCLLPYKELFACLIFKSLCCRGCASKEHKHLHALPRSDGSLGHSSPTFMLPSHPARELALLEWCESVLWALPWPLTAALHLHPPGLPRASWPLHPTSTSPVLFSPVNQPLTPAGHRPQMAGQPRPQQASGERSPLPCPPLGPGSCMC